MSPMGLTLELKLTDSAPDKCHTVSHLKCVKCLALCSLTGPDPDTLPGSPGWSRLVKSHCTIPREDTVELHFKEGSKHMH